MQALIRAAERLRVIRDAAIEVRTPTVFGQLIIMIVYIPILTLEGVEGKMFRPMAWTVMFVLVGSLMLSLTLTPVLASLFLPKRIRGRGRAARAAGQAALSAALAAGCCGNRVCMRRRAAVALVLAVWHRRPRFGSEFVPRLSEGAIVIGIVRPPGTNLDESLRINQRMEQILLAGVSRRSRARLEPRRLARSADRRQHGRSDRPVRLAASARAVEEGPDASRAGRPDGAGATDIPGQTIWFTQPIEQRINEMISGVRADVALKLFGNDFDKLVDAVAELEQVLRAVPGCSRPVDRADAGPADPAGRDQAGSDRPLRHSRPAGARSGRIARQQSRWAKWSKGNCGFRWRCGCPIRCGRVPSDRGAHAGRAVGRADSAVAAGRRSQSSTARD